MQNGEQDEKSLALSRSHDFWEAFIKRSKEMRTLHLPPPGEREKEGQGKAARARETDPLTA